MAILIVLVLLVGFALMLLVGLLLALPAISEGLERIRIEREAAEASWRIHQQATAAFSQMLEVARQDSEDES